MPIKRKARSLNSASIIKEKLLEGKALGNELAIYEYRAMKLETAIISVALAMQLGSSQGQYSIYGFLKDPSTLKNVQPEGREYLHRLDSIKENLYGGIDDLAEVYYEIRRRLKEGSHELSSSMRQHGPQLMEDLIRDCGVLFHVIIGLEKPYDKIKNIFKQEAETFQGRVKQTGAKLLGELQGAIDRLQAGLPNFDVLYKKMKDVQTTPSAGRDLPQEVHVAIGKVKFGLHGLDTVYKMLKDTFAKGLPMEEGTLLGKKTTGTRPL